MPKGVQLTYYLHFTTAYLQMQIGLDVNKKPIGLKISSPLFVQGASGSFRLILTHCQSNIAMVTDVRPKKTVNITVNITVGGLANLHKK